MSEYKVTDGEYWVARMSDGQWGVFWSHPSLDDWHRLVARFSSEDRAERYRDVENDCLEPDEYSKDVLEPDDIPVFIEPPSQLARLPAPNRAMLREFSERLLLDLPEMFANSPGGLGTRDIMEKYGASYAAAVEGMKWLHYIGSGKWVYRRGQGGAKVLLHPDVEVEESDLTQNQEQVFDAMRDMADEFGCVTEPYVAIAARSNVSAGGMSQVLHSLEKKGYIMLAKPAGRNGTSPAVYQIIADTEMLKQKA